MAVTCDILLLEDDTVLAKQIAASLEHMGHTVAVFGRASQALAHFDAHQVSLVIADLFIKVDEKYIQDGGIRLISNIRQIRNSAVPIIAISGAFPQLHGVQSETSAKTVGANEVLAKPFHPDELVKLVAKVLSALD